MRRKTSKSLPAQLQPRWRVVVGRDIALGPGKAELLEEIQRTGSIQLAAQAMGLSYMRAWMLVKTMQGCFRKPLIRVTRGGRKGGGAILTPFGEQALRRYRDLERRALRAAGPDWRPLRAMLRK